MSLHLACAQCGKNLSVPESAAGKKIRCPACQHVFVASPPAEPTEVLEVFPAPAAPPKRERSQQGEGVTVNLPPEKIRQRELERRERRDRPRIAKPAAPLVFQVSVKDPDKKWKGTYQATATE